MLWGDLVMDTHFNFNYEMHRKERQPLRNGEILLPGFLSNLEKALQRYAVTLTGCNINTSFIPGIDIKLLVSDAAGLYDGGTFACFKNLKGLKPENR